MAGANVLDSHVSYGRAIRPCRFDTACAFFTDSIEIFGSPFLVEFFNGYGRLKIIRVLVVFNQSGVSVVVSRKIRLRLQRLANGFSGLGLSDGHHGAERLTQVSVLDFTYLTETVGQTATLIVLGTRLSGFDRWLKRETAMRTGCGFIADLQFAFGAFD